MTSPSHGAFVTKALPSPSEDFSQSLLPLSSSFPTTFIPLLSPPSLPSLSSLPPMPSLMLTSEKSSRKSQLRRSATMSSSNSSASSRSYSDTHTAILNHYAWIRYQVKYFSKGLPSYISQEDCFQIALLELLLHGDSYDPSKGAFSTFAYFHIRRALSDTHRKLYRGIATTFIPHESLDSIPEQTSPSFSCDPLFRSFLQRTLSYITPHQCLVLSLIIFDELALSDIASLLNISRQAVQEAYNCALTSLRSRLSQTDKKMFQKNLKTLRRIK